MSAMEESFDNDSSNHSPDLDQVFGVQLLNSYKGLVDSVNSQAIESILESITFGRVLA
jgi:hypothetical protein